jgi:predicted small secreted protein
MKKFLMILVAATLALSITGCKKKTAADEAGDAVKEAAGAVKDAADAAKKEAE